MRIKAMIPATRMVSLWTIITALFCLLTSPVSAGVIEFDFSGTIYYGQSTGGHFSGSFSFDPAEAGLIPPPFYWPYQSEYTLGPSSNLTVSADDGTSSFTEGNLEIGLAMYPADFSGLGGTGSTDIRLGVIDAADQTTATLFLHNNHQMVLPNLSLPLRLDRSDFTGGELVLSKNPGGVVLWSGTLDSLTVVPEPTCTSLVCVLIAGSLTFRRRQGN
jgi:hypothetical protein